MQGKISHIVPEKGYGFIKNEEHPNGLFFHIRDTSPDITFMDLHVGDIVSFEEVVQSEKGFSCRGVDVV